MRSIALAVLALVACGAPMAPNEPGSASGDQIADTCRRYIAALDHARQAARGCGSNVPIIPSIPRPESVSECIEIADDAECSVDELARLDRVSVCLTEHLCEFPGWDAIAACHQPPEPCSEWPPEGRSCRVKFRIRETYGADATKPPCDY